MAEISFSRENLINRTPSYITHDNSDEIISIDLSLDGSLVLTGALDDTANAYLVTSGCKEFNYVDKPYGINNLKFTSNNDLIYSNRKGSVGIIKKISLNDKSVLWLSNFCHSAPITSIDTGINSNCVSVSKDRVMKLWDLKCDKCIHSTLLSGASNPKVRFDSSSSIIALVNSISVNKNYLKFYDLKKLNEPYYTVEFNQPQVNEFEFSDDGLHILLSTESSCVLLDSFEGVQKRIFFEYKNEGGKSIGSLTENSEFLAVGCESGNQVKVFDTNSGDVVSELVGHPRTPRRVIWSKHYGVLFSACQNLVYWAID